MPAAKRDSPAAKRTYHHGDLRAALLAAAEEELAERGMESFSLRSVATLAHFVRFACARQNSLRPRVAVVTLQLNFCSTRLFCAYHKFSIRMRVRRVTAGSGTLPW